MGVDRAGRPIAGREVRAEPTAKDENRDFDPTTKIRPDGSFTLSSIRPGEHFIQAGPFWLEADQAPEGSSKVLTLEAGQAKAVIEFKAGPER